MIPPPRVTRRPLSPLAVGVGWFLLALALRLWHLGAQSLWADEGVTWWYSTKGTWTDTLFAEPNHPPVWYLTTRAWLSVFPASEASLRMDSINASSAMTSPGTRMPRALSCGTRQRYGDTRSTCIRPL